MAHIGIAGAGLLGRLLAWTLGRAGHAVAVFDPALGPAPAFDGRGAAAFSAAGMLSPLAELDQMTPALAALGWRSIALWSGIAAQLPPPSPSSSAPLSGVFAQGPFACRGSLLLAHGPDLGSAERTLARLSRGAATQPAPERLDAAGLAALEPAVHGPAHAWWLPGEAQVHPVALLQALQAHAGDGVRWHWQQTVQRVEAGALVFGDGAQRRYDLAIDVRGLGARIEAEANATGIDGVGATGEPGGPIRSETTGGRAASPAGCVCSTKHGGSTAQASCIARLRGVRGETVWLHAPAHGLTRPLRLLHPRHRVYVVPRDADRVFVGASEVESEDRSPVSLRSAVELMAAAHSVMPVLAEARIEHLDRNLRPALPDHAPRIEQADGLLRINGLFRHGWLLAPALVFDALAQAGLADVRAPAAVPAPTPASPDPLAIEAMPAQPVTSPSALPSKEASNA